MVHTEQFVLQKATPTPSATERQASAELSDAEIKAYTAMAESSDRRMPPVCWCHPKVKFGG